MYIQNDMNIAKKVALQYASSIPEAIRENLSIITKDAIKLSVEHTQHMAIITKGR